MARTHNAGLAKKWAPLKVKKKKTSEAYSSEWTPAAPASRQCAAFGETLASQRMRTVSDGPRLLLLLLLTAALASGRPQESLVGHASQHQELAVVSGRSLVPVRTLDGDVAWVEARFLNETHVRSFKHQSKPFAVVEKVSIIMPVLTFLVPFLVWVFCMVICLHRSHQRHSYY
ncbi:uncharacterized protein LOC125942692 [Dermacentor silvarum]|uniref:uncharacterized protein LOC125942692 n=1 Tax=Dermacentor silvarum TaxID=543639 RepID=UPI002100A2A7|nr:uncharacterized protein LOC125942692 [Dermacentor silvarum]